MFKVPEKHRVMRGRMASNRADGNNGAFFIGAPLSKTPLTVIASDGMGWEHVSVSTPTRCPNWKEMCLIKKLFWDDDDCVIQFHPPKSDYVNNHPFCLHLWRPTNQEIPRPEWFLVGIKDRVAI